MNVELSIRRNASPAYLDARGKWAGEQQWLRFGNGLAREGRLVIEVGPAIVDAVLEAKRNASFLVEVREPGGTATRYPVRQIPHGVTPSSAAGEAPAQASIVDVAPKPSAPLPVAAPIPAPVEARADTGQAASPPPARPMGAILCGVLALLVAAGAAAWFILMQGEAAEPQAKPITQAVAPAPESAAVACSKESMTSAAEMTFVQDCVRDVKDSAAMLAIIQAAREAGKCSIAQRLYANQAQGGDVRIALAYAQEYDPATYKENACFKADGATAAYWYQAVLEKDKDNAQAQARLKDLPK
ncbi:hypothetical protein BIZ92_29900 [Achromobacter xylosoxidans]|uniref:Uncharacterized protein n=1 Tax=Alcaligenes xylosoxydans xylosoxydans TaxID=85698 RepID=A0A1R1JR10_ALCXX|nr:hypothetical protein BIZ92_29900 [Achromobacter xylosoxidans]